MKKISMESIKSTMNTEHTSVNQEALTTRSEIMLNSAKSLVRLMEEFDKQVKEEEYSQLPFSVSNLNSQLKEMTRRAKGLKQALK